MAGIIKVLLVKEGDRIRQGQVIAITKFTHKIMIPNPRRSIEILVDTIAIVFTIWIHIPAANAQPSSPAPATKLESPPVPTKLRQAPSYVGLGGVIVIHGGTTSLAQGTCSILTTQVLTENLAIHNANTI
jgi:pyruvate/2-oxoglutarate dehydrogenase complex dihydrolipoamide acyltransferase (E2) component